MSDSGTDRKNIRTRRDAKKRGSRGTIHIQEPPKRRVEANWQDESNFKFKIWLMVFFIFACFIFLCYRIIAIKIEFGDEYTRRAMAQLINGGTESDKAVNPNRGAILDRNRQTLASSTIVYNIFLDIPKILKTAETDDKEEGEDTIRDTFLLLNEVLGISMDELYSYVAINPETNKPVLGNNHYFIFARGVKSKDALILSEKKDENGKVMRDVYLEAQSERNYIFGNLAPQIIGFMRGDGSYGLERYYNAELVGIPGRIFRSFSGGSVMTDRIEAVEGNTLITTLDFQMQQFIEELCVKYAEEYQSPNTSAIVMNPYTGEIYTMAQSPQFDLNHPVDYNLVTDNALAEELITRAVEDETAALEKMYGVWANFNITDTFEPGSIFKPVTIAAALEEGIIDLERTYYCGGSKQVASNVKPINCHKESGHGIQTLDEAIMNSCNVALMIIAEELGKEKFYQYQRDFGYGEKTGIDLPAEANALSLLHTLSGLGVTELATSSFGQRFNCTPIQAINSFAAVINGGNLMQPYIVSHMADSKGAIVYEKTPTVIRKVISEETSNYLRESMEKVVSQGTGKRAIIEGYAIGGKTGTGEQGIRDTDDYSHSVSFVGYLPVDNPQYLVMTLINKVGENYEDGVTNAGDMIREIFQYIIDNKNIPSTDSEIISIPEDKSLVPNVVGQPLDITTGSLSDVGLNYELIGGSGTVVVSQRPDAGTIVPKGTTVWLTIETDDSYEMATIPDVFGYESSVAEAMLIDAGFKPVVVYDEDDEVAEAENGEIHVSEENDEPHEQKVYKQMPEANMAITVGSTVKIMVQ